jgi:hypothetical protein
MNVEPQLKRCSKLLANPARRLNGSLWLAGLLCAAVAHAAAAQERVNETGAAVKGFTDRVTAYVDLQKKQETGLPATKPREDTSKMEIHQRALAARMRLARPNAQPGDLFGSAARLIQDVVRKDAEQRSTRDAKASMEEVPQRRPLRVNAEYPEKAALATVPPLLLTNLPRLPEGLEYRFMGRDLVLRDTKANLIADFIREAAPIVKR